MLTAVIRFSGICTHIQKGYWRGADAHFAMLADVAEPERYQRIPGLFGVPAHTARLLVAASTIRGCFPAIEEWHVEGDAVCQTLAGDAVVTIMPAGGAAEAAALELTYSASWQKAVPRLHALAPPPMEHPRAIALGIEQRRAATVEIGFGTVDDVDHDPRTGESGVEWRFPTASGRVYVTIDAPDGSTRMLDLEVPERRLPVQPLIWIENAGTDNRDSREDFLFHYYLLFAGVPPGAKTPRGRSIDEGGTTTACSNSTYP